jgi:enoyl-CoA hydratase
MIVGKAKAMELILSANIIDANEAYRIGLVNAVYSFEELMIKTEEFMKLILTKGPIAIAGAIECINSAFELSPTDGLDFETRKFGEICGTSDFKEGTQAFLEKRKANFSGK